MSQWIINPIRTITQAMTRLSQGHRDIRFTNNFYHDEIGEIIDGYEYSRCKLLQADISLAVGMMKPSVSLNKTESEKKIFASIDPLTDVNLMN